MRFPTTFTCLRIAAATALCLTAGIATASAQSKGPSVLIVHGIIGTDLSSSLLPTLPINIQIGSVCLKQTVSFGDVIGPLPVPVGSIPITVSLANIAFPCTNSPVISTKILFSSTTTIGLVLAESTKGAPAAETFSLTAVNPVGAGTARALIVHAANAPAVDATLTDPSGNVLTATDIAPGAESPVLIAPFTNYGARVLPTGTTTVVAGPVGFAADARSVEGLFVVGSAANGTVTVIRKDIDGNF